MSQTRPPDVRTYFDQEASRYLDERYVRPSCDQLSYQSRRRLALELLGRGPGHVVDIGSGPGVFTSDLLARGFGIAEVDVSLDMLRESRQRVRRQASARRVAFVEGRLPDLPFADRTFDAALCIGVLAYLPEPAGGLREIRRILKPGGVAVVQISNALCPTSRLHSLLRRGYRRLGEALGGSTYPHLRIPLASFRLRDLRRMLERERFHVDSWARYDFRPPLLEWLSPSAALTISRRLQRFERSGSLGWAAEGLVLKARAC
jgi:ubiquinone/menaquinone biosynthesis C-methylase UbiE